MKKLVKLIIFPSLFLLGCSADQGNSENVYSTDDGGYYDVKEESEYTVDEEYDATTTSTAMVKNTAGASNNGNDDKKSAVGTSDISGEQAYHTKIIRNADVKFKVEDVKKASSQIQIMAENNGGYISSEDMNANKQYYQTIETTDTYRVIENEVNVSNFITIRVPSENFQKLLTSMKGISISEDYVKVNAQDVTEEYYDLETRLKTKKEVEARYIEILKSKAKTVEEILIAEDKIRFLREEIEAVEGRLRLLKNKVGLSTIQIEIYQDAYFVKEKENIKRYETNIKSTWSFWDRVGDALYTGWNAILVVLIILLYLWPLWLIGFGLLWFFRRRMKRKKVDQMKP